MINGTTRLFGVLGNPVAHSLSPAMAHAALSPGHAQLSL